MKNRILIFSFLCLLVGIAACNRGVLNENNAPETSIFVGQINLSGQNRLTTEVPLFWSGSDKDGYVTGYEISFDNATWDLVTTTDSVFKFTLSAGSDTTDIDFWVRSVDDLGLVDPTPAYLAIPIKNSPPTAIIDTVITIPDTVYTVMTMAWIADDPDGIDNLDSIFLKVNNSQWYGFEPSTSIITLVPQTPENAGTVTSDLYLGITAEDGDFAVDGLNLDGDNQVFVFARDVSGEESPVDTSNVFYVKRKTADLLMVQSHQGGSSPTPEDIYRPILANTYGTFDYLNIERNDNENLPRFWSPTFKFLIDLYDIVFWAADEGKISISEQLYMEAASSVLQEYLNEDGKLLATMKFPSSFDPTSTIFQFSPIDSLFCNNSGQARMNQDSLMVPTTDFAADYDILRPSIFLTGVDPVYLKPSADAMYTGNLQLTGCTGGSDVLGARTVNFDGNTNQVFFSVELHNMNGDPAALETLFNELFSNEFNW